MMLEAEAGRVQHRELLLPILPIFQGPERYAGLADIITSDQDSPRRTPETRSVTESHDGPALLQSFPRPRG